jgi:hypothetical protein
MSTESHELTSLMQQPLISNWDNYTIKIGLRRIQNLCHQSSFLGPVQPQELKMEKTDSPDKQIVGANGIPRGCMSFPQGPPLHLLRQAWNQIDCSWTSLNSLDRFLSNVAMLTLKSMQKLTSCALT